MRGEIKVQILFTGFWGRYKNFLEKALNTKYITYTLMKQRKIFDLCLDISNIVLSTQHTQWNMVMESFLVTQLITCWKTWSTL